MIWCVRIIVMISLAQLIFCFYSIAFLVLNFRVYRQVTISQVCRNLRFIAAVSLDCRFNLFPYQLSVFVFTCDRNNYFCAVRNIFCFTSDRTVFFNLNSICTAWGTFLFIIIIYCSGHTANNRSPSQPWQKRAQLAARFRQQNFKPWNILKARNAIKPI